VQEHYGDAVSVHMRHFPLPMHKQAEPAARAMQAAKRQGKEWQMADVIFANMRALSDQDILAHAEKVGLDVQKFKADFDGDEVKKEVAADVEAGKKAGVRGTPTIFINGVRYQGERTLDAMKPTIDAEIKKADDLIKSGTPLEKVYDSLAGGAK
jgi:predicted DsbA family dithiol-disulfide isomerase